MGQTQNLSKPFYFFSFLGFFSFSFLFFLFEAYGIRLCHLFWLLLLSLWLIFNPAAPPPPVLDVGKGEAVALLHFAHTYLGSCRVLVCLVLF